MARGRDFVQCGKTKSEPKQKAKNNLALIRKFAYNILRIAMLSKSCEEIMTEAMDDFCDDPFLTEKKTCEMIKGILCAFLEL